MFYTFQIGSFPSPRFNFLSISWLVQATHGTFTEDWILELVLLYYPPTHGTPHWKPNRRLNTQYAHLYLYLYLHLYFSTCMYLYFSTCTSHQLLCSCSWNIPGEQQFAAQRGPDDGPPPPPMPDNRVFPLFISFFLCFDWSLFWLVSVRGPYDNPPPPLMPCYCFFTLQMCVF